VNIALLDSCIIIDYIKDIGIIKNLVDRIEIPCINFIVEIPLTAWISTTKSQN
jgi:hypothetical protein